jgi:hypothetical protein
MARAGSNVRWYVRAPAGRPLGGGRDRGVSTTAGRRTPLQLRRGNTIWLQSAVVYGVLLLIAVLYGYWLIFSGFAQYDDEGFFDFTLRLFLHGHPLYSTVWTTYGPFYYELFGLVYKVLGHEPTTDSGRLVQLTVWALTSLVLGLVAQRITRRLSVGAAVFASAFYLMRALVNEPMHTEALICLLLALTVAVVVFALPQRPRGALVAIGALSAALLLSKINVGGYAVVSIAFAAAMTGGSIMRRRWLSWLVAALFVVLGPLIMVSDLNTGTTQTYALVIAASALSIALVAMPDGVETAADDGSWSWIGWLAAGVIGMAVLVIAVLFALGTGPGAFVHSVLIEPARQSNFLSIPATFGGNAVSWTLAATALAWVYRASGWATRPPSSSRARILSAIVRLLGGLAIILSLTDFFPFQIAPDAPFALAMPLAFLAAIPPLGELRDPLQQFTRLLVPALAVLQCLLAYPVAGGQLYFGGILLFACGALCLADAGTELELSERIRAVSVPWTRRALTGLFVAVAVGTGYLLLLNQMEATHGTYRSQVPVPIPGVSRLHLPTASAQQFGEMDRVLLSRCSTLISLPALYSFNNWTGLPWPNAIGGAQPYWKELSSSQQRDTLRAAQRSPRLCVIRDLTQAESYGTVTRTPLVAYLEGPRFKTILDSPPYSIAVRRS